MADSLSAETAGSVQHDGSGWEAVEGNTSVTVSASAAQSGTTNHAITNPNHNAALIFVDATASSGDGTEDLDVNIQIQDPASGKWITVIADASALANGATGTLVYGVGLGVADTQTILQAVEEIPLPRDLRVQTIVQQGGGSGAYTYSVGAAMVV